MPELRQRMGSFLASAAWRRRLSWIAIAYIVVFWRLGYPSLFDPDEAHYAELTREMLHAHNWLVPLLDGKPFIDKPVFFHWLQATAITLFGDSEFSLRLPSALGALGLFAIVRWAGAILLGAEVGEWGAIMLATVPIAFALSSIGLFDMVFAAFLFGGVCCLLVAAKTSRPRVEWCGYGLIAFATMTKGPVALVLIAIFLSAAWCVGGSLRARIAPLRWKTGLTAAAMLASPWFIWMYAHFGPAFIDGYLLAGNLWYFTQPVVFSSRAVSHTFYLRTFAGAFFPWSAVAAGRAVDALRRRWTGLEIDTDEALLWLWAATVFGFFSIARFKLDHYVFPAAPACCLIAARAWRDASARRAGTAATRVGILAVAALLIVAGAFGSIYLFDLNLELPETAIVLPFALLIGGTMLMAASARLGWNVPRTSAIPVVMLLVVYATTAVVGYPVLETTRPTAAVGRRLHQVLPADATVGLYRLERWRASLRYYSGHSLTALEKPGDVAALAARTTPAYVVLRRQDYDDLRSAGIPLYELIERRCVVGTTGHGLRRQRWGFLIVATNVPPPPHRRRVRVILP